MNEARVVVRHAISVGDGAGLVAVLRGEWPPYLLQRIGDGLLAVVARGVDAQEPIERCIAELVARGWDGDRELAAELEAALGRAPSPALQLYRSEPLRPVHADLDEIADHLEGDGMDGSVFLDTENGFALPEVAWREGGDIELGVDDFEDDRFIGLGHLGSRPGYSDMELFIDSLDDPDFADRLNIAISGPGAFRRFKDVLSRDRDLFDEYAALSDERKRGRARAVLADRRVKPAVSVEATGVP